MSGLCLFLCQFLSQPSPDLYDTTVETAEKPLPKLGILLAKLGLLLVIRVRLLTPPDEPLSCFASDASAKSGLNSLITFSTPCLNRAY